MEPQAKHAAVARSFARESQVLADWWKLDSIRVGPRDDLVTKLAAAVHAIS